MECDPKTGLLPIPGAYNVRELGGMRTKDGRTIHTHRLIRSDALDRLSPEDVDLLAEYPIQAVIDLRSSIEAQMEPDAVVHDPRFTYYNISLLHIDSDFNGNNLILDTQKTSLGHLYVWMSENSKADFAEVYRTILREAPKTVLFHCAHGKDRTGLIAALLYLLCGVDRKDIIDNYSISYTYVRELVAPLIAKVPPEAAHVYRSDASNMEMFLAHLDQHYQGDARVYLRSTGLSDAEIDALRDLLLN